MRRDSFIRTKEMKILQTSDTTIFLDKIAEQIEEIGNQAFMTKSVLKGLTLSP